MPAQLAHALPRDSAMQRHIIDALPRLPFDHFKKALDAEIHNRSFRRDLVNRHRAENHLASGENLAANLVEVGTRREIHHGIGAVAHRRVKLLDFFFDQLMEIRRADIRVDLGPQALADANRAELVMLVVRDHHLAGRDQPANLLDVQPFVFGHFNHLLSNNAFACSFKLGHVATSS